MNKPYSDKRWHDDPGANFSLCGDCRNWLGFGKCKKYDEKVPKEVMDQSFPNTEKFREDYCKHRQRK